MANIWGRKGRRRKISIDRQTKIAREGGRLDLWKHEDDCHHEVLFLVEEDDLIEGRNKKERRKARGEKGAANARPTTASSRVGNASSLALGLIKSIARRDRDHLFSDRARRVIWLLRSFRVGSQSATGFNVRRNLAVARIRGEEGKGKEGRISGTRDERGLYREIEKEYRNRECK